jgi:hypothetical protein
MNHNQWCHTKRNCIAPGETPCTMCKVAYNAALQSENKTAVSLLSDLLKCTTPHQVMTWLTVNRDTANAVVARALPPDNHAPDRDRPTPANLCATYDFPHCSKDCIDFNTPVCSLSPAH